MIDRDDDLRELRDKVTSLYNQIEEMTRALCALKAEVERLRGAEEERSNWEAEQRGW